MSIVQGKMCSGKLFISPVRAIYEFSEFQTLYFLVWLSSGDGFFYRYCFPHLFSSSVKCFKMMLEFINDICFSIKLVFLNANFLLLRLINANYLTDNVI